MTSNNPIDEAANVAKAGIDEAAAAAKQGAQAAQQAVDDMEVEVHVKQLDDPATNADASAVTESFRKLLLAGIGAVAVTYDEADKLTRRLVERGELAQKDGEKLLKEMTNRMTPPAAQQQGVQGATAPDAPTSLEASVERLLSSMSVPSKRDIDELSARIAQLTARVEELAQKSGN